MTNYTLARIQIIMWGSVAAHVGYTQHDSFLTVIAGLSCLIQVASICITRIDKTSLQAETEGR